jgi:hypothetical protein
MVTKHKTPRDAAAIDGMIDDYVVDPLPVVAGEAGISLSTLLREEKAGRLVITKMSPRRVGVQRRHKRQWLNARSAGAVA